MDPLKLWPFVALIFGIGLAYELCTSSWRCSMGAESRTSSLRSWRLRFFDWDWLSRMALPIYMIHQFEEHGFDAKGRRYEFQASLCKTLVSYSLSMTPSEHPFAS